MTVLNALAAAACSFTLLVVSGKGPSFSMKSSTGNWTFMATLTALRKVGLS